MVTFDPVCYSLNSTAMGDVLAALPVLNYAIKTYHKECDYRVVISKHFKDLIPFVPKDKILEMEDDTWRFDKQYSVRRLNDVGKKGGNLCRLTPAKMTLSHYAAIGLLGKILTKQDYDYLPLPEVNISHFGLDCQRSIVMVVSYRDINRSIPSEELLKIAEYIHIRGFVPVFVGKTDEGAWKDRPPVSPFIPPTYGVDLRNKTSILELATIMSKAVAVLGVDSGPIHLAGTTGTPIISGYTNVDWKFRVPVRAQGRTIVIEPDPMDCRYCSSNWLKDFYDFLNCHYGHNNCVKTLTAKKYIHALDAIIGEKEIKQQPKASKKVDNSSREYMPISTVISFSSSEKRFLDALITEVKYFCNDIIIVAYDHFFNGDKEDIALLDDLQKKYPDVHWLINKWDYSKEAKFWHNYARWSGSEIAAYNRVLFLDADEIPDGYLMKRWLTSDAIEKFSLYVFSCNWYFRHPKNQAISKEMCGLLADMSKLKKEMFFSKWERWFFKEYKSLSVELNCTLNGNIILNHFSWVRSKEEMLTKVKSWAHSSDCNWVNAIHKEFTHKFMCKDFVHGYSYRDALNIFDIPCGDLE